jgi:thioredoxin reductase (NADPH)
VRSRTVVEEVLGNGSLAGVRVRDLLSGATEEVELAALFVFIGLVPSTDFLRDVVDLDDEGRVPTDAWMRTNAPGLFAAGDIRTDSARQAIAAAGDGATAAVAAYRYLAETEPDPAR